MPTVDAEEGTEEPRVIMSPQAEGQDQDMGEEDDATVEVESFIYKLFLPSDHHLIKIYRKSLSKTSE